MRIGRTVLMCTRVSIHISLHRLAGELLQFAGKQAWFAFENVFRISRKHAPSNTITNHTYALIDKTVMARCMCRASQWKTKKNSCYSINRPNLCYQNSNFIRIGGKAFFFSSFHFVFLFEDALDLSPSTNWFNNTLWYWNWLHKR